MDKAILQICREVGKITTLHLEAFFSGFLKILQERVIGLHALYHASDALPTAVGMRGRTPGTPSTLKRSFDGFANDPSSVGEGASIPEEAAKPPTLAGRGNSPDAARSGRGILHINSCFKQVPLIRKGLCICSFMLLLLAGLVVLATEVQAQTKLRDLVQIQGARENQLIGYGLVTGLDRTGDRSISRRGAVFTVQSIANMLSNFGINVNQEYLRTRNVAAVMVTATVGPYHLPGSELDITVSSLGDASSLQGGVLLRTPLMNPQTKDVYAYAQGPLITGGINAEVPGARVAHNLTLTATIPGGASVVKNDSFTPSGDAPLGLILRKPNYKNAQRITEVINTTLGGETEIASAASAGLVQVEWPEDVQTTGGMNQFMSMVLDLEIETEAPAIVVINERTGTIVAGGNVIIDEVLVSHGSIQIQTQVTPFVSQPPPFSGGETVAGAYTEVGVTEEAAQNMVIPPDTRATELAASLSNLGLSPRDIISIFQAIERAGALNGRLVVM